LNKEVTILEVIYIQTSISCRYYPS